MLINPVSSKTFPDLFPTPRTSSAPVWCNRITEDAASPADDSATNVPVNLLDSPEM
jgi:hypothetical protein